MSSTGIHKLFCKYRLIICCGPATLVAGNNDRKNQKFWSECPSSSSPPGTWSSWNLSLDVFISEEPGHSLLSVHRAPCIYFYSMTFHVVFWSFIYTSLSSTGLWAAQRQTDCLAHHIFLSPGTEPGTGWTSPQWAVTTCSLPFLLLSASSRLNAL